MTQTQFTKLCKLLNVSDRLILRIGVETGLRISDILRLKVNQISNEFEVIEQKTKKKRTVFLKKTTINELNLYIKSQKLQNNSKIFYQSRQTTYRNLNNLAKSLGYKNISSHSARKLFAITFLKKNNNNLALLQKELNHDNINTTLIYIMKI